MEKDKIIKIYFLVVVLELIGEVLFHFTDSRSLIYAFKPLLMPTLIYWYIKSDENYSKTIVYALIFAFIGDFSLMFLHLNPLFFLIGLCSFLMTHLLYIFLFNRYTDKNEKSIFWRRPHLALPFLLFGLSFMAFLFRENSPKFIEMQIPLIIYTSVIMLMVLSAIGRFNKASQSSFSWVLVGAILFMFSDTIIALVNFSDIFEGFIYLGNVIIMLLYCLAQYLIIKGLLDQKSI